MIMRSKKRNDDEIGPSRGLMKWVNRLFRLILYPFIHPWWFAGIVIAAVLAAVAVPIYFGVAVENIPNWYFAQFGKHYTKAEAVLVEKVVAPLKSTVEEKVQLLSGQGSKDTVIVKAPKKETLVDYNNLQAVNRRAFQKAQEIPVDVKKTLQASRKEKANVSFKRNENLELVYLEEPRRIDGVIEVVNANEIKIDGEMFFLYGIYASMASEQGKNAAKYLQDNVGGQAAECYVGAYTKGGIGTVICIYQGKNINQQLVDLGYSEDVSLN